MKTLQQKIDNLKEMVENLNKEYRTVNAKTYYNSDDYIFAVDNELSGYYDKFIRMVDVKDFKISSMIFEINDYNMNISNNKVDFKNKQFYIVSKKSNKSIEKGLLYTFKEFEEYKIEEKILNKLFNTNGNKADFKELNKDYLLMFIEDNPNFFDQSNIERLLMEQQLKDF